MMLQSLEGMWGSGQDMDNRAERWWLLTGNISALKTAWMWRLLPCSWCMSINKMLEMDQKLSLEIGILIWIILDFERVPYVFPPRLLLRDSKQTVICFLTKNNNNKWETEFILEQGLCSKVHYWMKQYIFLLLIRKFPS